MFLTIGGKRATIAPDFAIWFAAALDGIVDVRIAEIDLRRTLSIDNDHLAPAGRVIVRHLSHSYISRYLRSADPAYLRNAVYCYREHKFVEIEGEAEVMARLDTLRRSLRFHGYPWRDQYIFSVVVNPGHDARLIVDGKHRAAILWFSGATIVPCVELQLRPGSVLEPVLASLNT